MWRENKDGETKRVEKKINKKRRAGEKSEIFLGLRAQLFLLIFFLFYCWGAVI